MELVFLFLATDEQQKSIYSDLSAPILDLLAFTVLCIAAKQSAVRSKRLAFAWGFLALAYFCYAFGDILWAIFELVLKVEPFPSSADVFYLAYYPLFLAGVLSLPEEPASSAERIRRAFDIVIILLTSTLGLWYFLFGPLMLSNIGEPKLDQYISIAYAIGDVVLLGALLRIVFSRIGENKYVSLIFLAGSLLATIITDFIYSYQVLEGAYASGGLLDLGWDISTLLIFLSGISLIVSNESKDNSRQSQQAYIFLGKFKSIIPFFPYVYIVAAYILLVIGGTNSRPVSFQSISMIVGGIIGLVLVRQIITLAENKKLSNQIMNANKKLQIEISEHNRIARQLSFDSMHDVLTGLANRALFLDRLGQIIENAKRRGNYSFSMLFIDLDRFKVINDSLGHLIGDKLILEVARRMKDCLRTSDTIARFGGDEFEILLNNTDDLNSILVVVRKITEAMHSPFEIDGHKLFITASIGIVQNLAGYDHADDVLRDADIAMYRAKSLGRDRYEIFNVKMRTEAHSRLVLENDLRKGLENKEFQLYYQPIIDLGTNRPVGLEALIRWPHSKRGLLLPEDFLEVAEESGLIIPIGDWVLHKACMQMKTWQEKYPNLKEFNINVNISSKQFSDPHFTERVKMALYTSELKIESLQLEITEQVLINNYPTANETFARLEKMGVQIQLDDFGTGYSALSYLQHFPINAVKIDKSFVEDMFKGLKSTKLIQAIIAMAHALDIDTIAEGIETEHELRELTSLSCDYGQGFLLSKPMDTVSTETVLAAVGTGSATPVIDERRKIKAEK